MYDSNGQNRDEYIRVLLDGGYESFRDRFQSFIDQCPTYLHSVGKPRFFTALFFGMFATAFDSGIADVNDEKMYFNFDEEGSLRVAVFSAKIGVVKCYAVLDNIREQNYSSKFSSLDKDNIKDELNRTDIDTEKLTWEEYVVSVKDVSAQGSKKKQVVCDKLKQRAFSNQDDKHQPNGLVFKPITSYEQESFLVESISRLASDKVDDVLDNAREVIKYIINIYNKYEEDLNFEDESDYHGFLSGFLLNFRYYFTAGIHLELFAGKGYADLILLVRSQQRLNDSIPIIIEIKAKDAEDANAALKQAENYVIRCPVSSLSIYSTAEDAVCIGLNFNMNGHQQLNLTTQKFLRRKPYLTERLLKYDGESIRESVEDYLIYPAYGIPYVTGSSMFMYTTKFVLSNAVFGKEIVTLESGGDVHVTKYVFQYSDKDNMQNDRYQFRRTIDKKVKDYISTTVLVVENLQENKIIVLSIRNKNHGYKFPEQVINMNMLGLRNDVKIYEVVCDLNNSEEYPSGLIVTVNEFPNYAEYSSRRKEAFDGHLQRTKSVNGVHEAVNDMMENIQQDEGVHKELFEKIFSVLSPLSLMVKESKEAELAAILHGLFDECDNFDKVIIEFQLGGGKKLDLVLSRFGPSSCLVGTELKVVKTREWLKRVCEEASEQLNGYRELPRYKCVTDGNEVALFPVAAAILDNSVKDPTNPCTLLYDVGNIIRNDNLEHSSKFSEIFRD